MSKLEDIPEGEREFLGQAILIATISAEVADQVKDDMMAAILAKLPEGSARSAALLTVTCMLMQAALAASLSCAKSHGPGHPMVNGTLKMFDDIVAPLLAELRSIADGA